MPGLLLSLFARLGVPEGLRKPLGYIGAVVACALLLWAVVAYIRHDAVSDYKDEQAGAVAVASAKASQAAVDAVSSYEAAAAQRRERAKAAASGSADPLKAGLDSLREGR